MFFKRIDVDEKSPAYCDASYAIYVKYVEYLPSILFVRIIR